MSNILYKKYKDYQYLEICIINYIEFLDKQIEKQKKAKGTIYSVDYLMQLVNTKEYLEKCLEVVYEKRK